MFDQRSLGLLLATETVLVGSTLVAEELGVHTESRDESLSLWLLDAVSVLL